MSQNANSHPSKVHHYLHTVSRERAAAVSAPLVRDSDPDTADSNDREERGLKDRLEELYKDSEMRKRVIRYFATLQALGVPRVLLGLLTKNLQEDPEFKPQRYEGRAKSFASNSERTLKGTLGFGIDQWSDSKRLGGLMKFLYERHKGTIEEIMAKEEEKPFSEIDLLLGSRKNHEYTLKNPNTLHYWDIVGSTATVEDETAYMWSEITGRYKHLLKSVLNSPTTEEVETAKKNYDEAQAAWNEKIPEKARYEKDLEEYTEGDSYAKVLEKLIEKAQWSYDLVVAQTAAQEKAAADQNDPHLDELKGVTAQRRAASWALLQRLKSKRPTKIREEEAAVRVGEEKEREEEDETARKTGETPLWKNLQEAKAPYENLKNLTSPEYVAAITTIYEEASQYKEERANARASVVRNVKQFRDLPAINNAVVSDILNVLLYEYALPAQRKVPFGPGDSNFLPNVNRVLHGKAPVAPGKEEWKGNLDVLTDEIVS